MPFRLYLPPHLQHHFHSWLHPQLQCRQCRLRRRHLLLLVLIFSAQPLLQRRPQHLVQLCRLQRPGACPLLLLLQLPRGTPFLRLLHTSMLRPRLGVYRPLPLDFRAHPSCHRRLRPALLWRRHHPARPYQMPFRLLTLYRRATTRNPFPMWLPRKQRTLAMPTWRRRRVHRRRRKWLQLRRLLLCNNNWPRLLLHARGRHRLAS